MVFRASRWRPKRRIGRLGALGLEEGEEGRSEWRVRREWRVDGEGMEKISRRISGSR